MTDTRTSVRSLDQVRHFRTALTKFLDVAATALEDADAQVQATIHWLRQDRQPYWKQQSRRLAEQLHRARQELNQKQAFQEMNKGAPQSFVDEKKAIEKISRQRDNAEERFEQVRKWLTRLEKDALEFRGMLQELSSTLDDDIPLMRCKIDQMLTYLEKYLAQTHPAAALRGQTESEASSAAQGGSARGPLAHDPALLERLRQATPTESWERDVPELAQRPTGLEHYQLGSSLDAWMALPHKDGPADRPGPGNVLLEECLGDCDVIYWERIEAAEESDSGWALASLRTEGPKRYFRLSGPDLQNRLPWTSALLSLPPGTMILMTPERIEAIYDRENRLLFADNAANNHTSPAKGSS